MMDEKIKQAILFKAKKQKQYAEQGFERSVGLALHEASHAKSIDEIPPIFEALLEEYEIVVEAREEYNAYRKRYNVTDEEDCENVTA